MTHPTRSADKIWENLLDNKCPKCGRELQENGYRMVCGFACDFSINNEKAFKLKNQFSQKTPDKIPNKRKVLANGKVVFKAAKVFKGTRPDQPYNFNF